MPLHANAGMFGGAGKDPVTNVVAPTITGTANVGQTLTANPGTWTGTPTPAFTYQWQRGTTNITGATSSTYVLVSADVGSTIRVQVTGTNDLNTVSLFTASTASVVDPFNATGGTKTTSGAYTYHAFTSSGNFVIDAGSPSRTIEYQIIGGGSYGNRGGYIAPDKYSAENSYFGGGGGCGQVTEGSISLGAGTHVVAIGAGAAWINSTNATLASESTLTPSGGAAIPSTTGGGGFGGVGGTGVGIMGFSGGNGQNGCGNGGTGNGSGAVNYQGAGGGGGGRGGNGANAYGTYVGGNGGAGFTTWIHGDKAGGGGGAGNAGSGTATAGGGNGGLYGGGHGAANSGAGGGGGGVVNSTTWYVGGNGGSGMVILRYLT